MLVTKDEFMAYERVRQSGATNMFDIAMVKVLSGLSKETIFEIMKNYSDLKKAYMN